MRWLWFEESIFTTSHPIWRNIYTIKIALLLILKYFSFIRESCNFRKILLKLFVSAPLCLLFACHTSHHSKAVFSFYNVCKSVRWWKRQGCGMGCGARGVGGELPPCLDWVGSFPGFSRLCLQCSPTHSTVCSCTSGYVHHTVWGPSLRTTRFCIALYTLVSE